MRKVLNYALLVIVIVGGIVVFFEKELSYALFGFSYKTPVEYSGFSVDVPKLMRYKKYENSSTFFYLFDDRFVEVGQKGNEKLDIESISAKLENKGISHEHSVVNVNGYSIAKFSFGQDNGDYPKYIYYILGTNIYILFYGDGNDLLELDMIVQNISIKK